MPVERAFTTLQPKVQELITLNRFLVEIKDPQLTFGVRQRAPAVAATLELETNLLKMPMAVNSTKDASTAATDSKPCYYELCLEKVVEKLARIEQLKTTLGATIIRVTMDGKDAEGLNKARDVTTVTRRGICMRLPLQELGKQTTTTAISQATKGGTQRLK